MLEQPASISVEQLQTMFYLVMYAIPGEQVLRGEEIGNLWNWMVDHGVENQDKNDRDAGTAMYSSTKEPLLEYMEVDSGLLWSAKRKTDIVEWPRWIGALPNLDGAKKDKVWIPNSEIWFLLTGIYCLRQYGHNGFDVVVPGRNPGSFMMVTGRESSSLCASPGSHEFLCYLAVKEKTGKVTVYGRRDSSTVISFFRSRVPAAQGL